jgi:hypothetical protein
MPIQLKVRHSTRVRTIWPPIAIHLRLLPASDHLFSVILVAVRSSPILAPQYHSYSGLSANVALNPARRGAYYTLKGLESEECRMVSPSR